MLNPIKLAYSPSPPDNGLGQYVSSPGNRAYCYAEFAVGCWEEVDDTGERVGHGFEKLFIGFLAARVKRWNVGITQSVNVWHNEVVFDGGDQGLGQRCV